MTWIYPSKPINLVPMLCMGMPYSRLRLVRDSIRATKARAPRHAAATQSVESGTPMQSMGTRE